MEKITIICTKCGAFLFTYYKYGERRVWDCFKNRIFDDCTITHFNLVKCPCGSVIGIDVGDYIRMKPNAFTY